MYGNLYTRAFLWLCGGLVALGLNVSAVTIYWKADVAACPNGAQWSLRDWNSGQVSSSVSDGVVGSWDHVPSGPLVLCKNGSYSFGCNFVSASLSDGQMLVLHCDCSGTVEAGPAPSFDPSSVKDASILWTNNGTYTLGLAMGFSDLPVTNVSAWMEQSGWLTNMVWLGPGAQAELNKAKQKYNGTNYAYVTQVQYDEFGNMIGTQLSVVTNFHAPANTNGVWTAGGSSSLARNLSDAGQAAQAALDAAGAASKKEQEGLEQLDKDLQEISDDLNFANDHLSSISNSVSSMDRRMQWSQTNQPVGLYSDRVTAAQNGVANNFANAGGSAAMEGIYTSGPLGVFDNTVHVPASQGSIWMHSYSLPTGDNNGVVTVNLDLNPIGGDFSLALKVMTRAFLSWGSFVVFLLAAWKVTREKAFVFSLAPSVQTDTEALGNRVPLAWLVAPLFCVAMIAVPAFLVSFLGGQPEATSFTAVADSLISQGGDLAVMVGEAIAVLFWVAPLAVFLGHLALYVLYTVKIEAFAALTVAVLRYVHL